MVWAWAKEAKAVKKVPVTFMYTEEANTKPIYSFGTLGRVKNPRIGQ